MERVTYLNCPSCKKQFYLFTRDYLEHKEAFAQCPFCTKQFKPEEGEPNPPMERTRP